MRVCSCVGVREDTWTLPFDEDGTVLAVGEVWLTFELGEGFVDASWMAGGRLIGPEDVWICRGRRNGVKQSNVWAGVSDAVEGGEDLGLLLLVSWLPLAMPFSEVSSLSGSVWTSDKSSPF